MKHIQWRWVASMVLGLVLMVGGLPASAADAVPDWLKARIAKYEKRSLGTVPNEVWTYPVAGKAVYLLRGPQPSVLLDGKGRVICHPDSDGKPTKGCPAAYAAPNQMAVVWQDPRMGLTVKPKADNTK